MSATPSTTKDPASEREALAVAAAAGDHQALADLYDGCSDRVYRWVLVRVGNNHHDAEDISAEVWVKVARSMRTYQSTGHGVMSWLITIAANTIRSTFRGTVREIPTASMLALDAPTGMTGPEDAALDDEASQVVATALGKLSKRDAEVVTLRFFHRFPVSEVSALTGLTPSNVKVIQHRAIRQLVNLLPDSYTRVVAVGTVEKGATRVRTTDSTHERASR